MISDQDRAAQVARQIRKSARDRMRLLDDDVQVVLLLIEQVRADEREKVERELGQRRYEIDRLQGQAQ